MRITLYSYQFFFSLYVVVSLTLSCFSLPFLAVLSLRAEALYVWQSAMRTTDPYIRMYVEMTDCGGVHGWTIDLQSWLVAEWFGSHSSYADCDTECFTKHYTTPHHTNSIAPSYTLSLKLFCYPPKPTGAPLRRAGRWGCGWQPLRNHHRFHHRLRGRESRVKPGRRGWIRVYRVQSKAFFSPS